MIDCFFFDDDDVNDDDGNIIYTTHDKFNYVFFFLKIFDTLNVLFLFLNSPCDVILHVLKHWKSVSKQRAVAKARNARTTNESSIFGFLFSILRTRSSSRPSNGVILFDKKRKHTKALPTVV